MAGAHDAEEYLARVPSPHRELLVAMRRLILEVAPHAKESIAYGMPTFTVAKARVGIAAYRRHCTFFPYSGTFLDAYEGELAGHSRTKSGVHFTALRPLPTALVRRMVRERLGTPPRKRAAAPRGVDSGVASREQGLPKRRAHRAGRDVRPS
ncbi:MAG: iron chaperone [Thermoplasmatota archaeon]